MRAAPCDWAAISAAKCAGGAPGGRSIGSGHARTGGVGGEGEQRSHGVARFAAAQNGLVRGGRGRHSRDNGACRRHSKSRAQTRHAGELRPFSRRASARTPSVRLGARSDDEACAGRRARFPTRCGDAAALLPRGADRAPAPPPDTSALLHGGGDDMDRLPGQLVLQIGQVAYCVGDVVWVVASDYVSVGVGGGGELPSGGGGGGGRHDACSKIPRSP
jgi:hypothetical protein